MQPTVRHILSLCPEALQQGRYTWRYGSALRSLVRDHLKNGVELYADLPGRMSLWYYTKQSDCYLSQT